MEVVNSFSETEKQERNNKLFSQIGWFIGTSQFFTGISAFFVIFAFDYIKNNYGFDIISMFGPNAKNIILISGFTTLLSGIVLMPPTLKLLRANYPFMNNLYAAPALALVLGLIGVFVLTSPDMQPKEAQVKTMVAQNVSETPKQEKAPEISTINQNEKLEEEKIQLRGTYYAR